MDGSALRLALVLCGLAGIGLTAGQPPGAPPRPEAQVAAMARLDYMPGTWTGEGWMEVAGKRMPFRGSEVVQRKLEGTVLLVEGAFFAKVPGAEAEVPVHTTLGVISFDPRGKTYRFSSWLATGASGEHELLVEERRWEWRLDSPAGRVRYRMTLTETGEWHEIGERLSEGGTWQQFFEMRLAKH